MAPSDLVFKKGDNRKALVVADVTFYVSRLAGLRSGARQALNRMLQLVGSHIRSYRTEYMTRPKKATPKVLASFEGWFGDRFPDREEYGLTLMSGESPDDVGPWSLKLRIQPSLLGGKSGFLQCSVPAESLETSPQHFVELVAALADDLDYRSGHAGYGVLYDEGDVIPSRDLQIRGWHGRFLGLDARDLGLTGGAFVDGIKGASWLTLLDADLADRLGGPKAIRETVATTASVTVLRNGVLIRAGEQPSLGDRNRQEDVSALRAVNNAVRPLRIERDIVMQPFGDAQQTREWLERLDPE